MPSTTPESHCEGLKITIGIPAYNERERIGILLQNLLTQVNSDVAEIIVNSSGSTDGTEEEVVETARSLQSSSIIRLITGKERLGKAAALNDIVLQSTGSILVFIDADTMVSKRGVKDLTNPFLVDEMIGLVSGNVRSLNDGDDLFSFMSKFQRNLHHKLCVHLIRDNLPPKVNGTFFAVRKDIVKSFPRHVISDDEYASWCAQRHGYKVAYAPKALVYTKDPTNFEDYIAKRRRIFGGHLLVKKFLHYKVPTTCVGALSVIFLRLASRYWRKMLHIITMLFLEFLCRILAFYDAVRDKVSYRYRVDSAKFTTTVDMKVRK